MEKYNQIVIKNNLYQIMDFEIIQIMSYNFQLILYQMINFQKKIEIYVWNWSQYTEYNIKSIERKDFQTIKIFFKY